MLAVDTNVLVYAADADSQFHTPCRDWLERQRAHHASMSSCDGHGTASAAWEFVTVLLASPGLAILVPTHRHADVAGEVILELPHLAGNLLHDAHTAILMREHGVRQICTRDTDFHQFAFLEVIDPLRS